MIWLRHIALKGKFLNYIYYGILAVNKNFPTHTGLKHKDLRSKAIWDTVVSLGFFQDQKQSDKLELSAAAAAALKWRTSVGGGSAWGPTRGPATRNTTWHSSIVHKIALVVLEEKWLILMIGVSFGRLSRFDVFAVFVTARQKLSCEKNKNN